MFTETSKKKYRKILLYALLAVILGAVIYYFAFINAKLPDKITVLAGKEQIFNFEVPAEGYSVSDSIGVLLVNDTQVDSSEIKLDFSRPFSFSSQSTGNLEFEVRLFGIFTLRKVNIEIVDNIEVIPCGIPIGIIAQTDGVLVLGTGTVTDEKGNTHEPSVHLLKSGDYITAMNGTAVNEKEILVSLIQEGKGDVCNFTVRRDDKEISVSVYPVMAANGEYKIGAWLRDDTQGIGTLTYITTTGEFGALGHGITDVDTGLLMEISGGTVYTSEIIAISKGKQNEPGELTGIIHRSSSDKIGSLISNTTHGIYGILADYPTKMLSLLKMDRLEIYEVGLKQEVQIGEASILCCFGNSVNEYSISIDKIDTTSKTIGKEMVISITDPKLLELTGGIVQGMSGSPILQNGKLIGAVTHVFVRDSTKGYGIFIENMLNLSDE